MPFLSEDLYQNLVRAEQPDAPMSVHLATWPQAMEERRNDPLIEAFDVIQKVVYLGRAAREASKVRVRQPLGRLLVRAPHAGAREALESHRDQVLEELNVKDLEFIAPDAELVGYRVKPNLPRIGKRYGKLIPAIRKALIEADGQDIARAVAQQQNFTVALADQTLEFEPEDVLLETTSAPGYACSEESGYLVALDMALSEPLIREGFAREIIRTVQETRKQTGLAVDDRIALRVVGDITIEAVLDEYKAYIMAETLATQWAQTTLAGANAVERTLDDVSWTIELEKLEK
jgi:isoleucyl-tRNA synthetase